MSHPIRIWSNAFAPSPDTNVFSIQVPKDIWSEAMCSEGSRRKFLRIEHPEGLEDWVAPLGAPYLQDNETDDPIQNVYLPLWMIDSAHFSGNGEESTMEVMGEDSFPEATRIVFRVIDSAFYNADVKEELERALSAMGVIRQHTTLQIPVQALGGFPIEVFVSKTEPANLVLCDGEEVAVEFEEPVDQIRPPTPIPELPPASTDFTQTMIPASPPREPQRFHAFQGEGHRLGGSNATIPEWRRGLPPPRR
jgi:hypothetical protein